MLHKFHMQHEKAAGLQTDKIQAGRESNISVAKNSLTTNINFSS